MPRPTDAPALPTFKEGKYYKVHLWRPVHYAGRALTPRQEITMLGEVAQELADRIYTAEEVADGPTG